MFLVRQDSISCLLDMGLGNRIKHLASAMRIAEHEGKALRVWWVRDGLGASFAEVFESIDGVDVMEVNSRNDLPPDLEGYQTGSWLWYRKEEIPEGRQLPYQDPEVGGVVQGVRARGFKVYETFHWISPALQEIYLPYFNRIRFAPEHDARVDTLWQEWGEENVVGVHIRCADDMMQKIAQVGMELPLSPSRVALEVRTVVEEGKGNRIFLATDRESFSQAFARELGELLLPSSKRIYSRGSLADVETAIDDLLILSRCSRLVLSYSSFGQCAWWMGQCPPAIRLGET